jgi:hypothetical protein
MSTPNKPIGTDSGQAEAPLAQLKEVWKRLPEAAQDYWREQFSSSRKQSDLRTEILTKFKIKLSTDGKLTLFRAWLEANDQRLLMAEKIESRKQELLSGGMTLAEAQDVLLTEASAYSVAARDFKLGMKVSSEISGARNLILAEKKAAAYDRAQAALTEGKKSKGGITKETLAKIEAELKLL